MADGKPAEGNRPPGGIALTGQFYQDPGQELLGDTAAYVATIVDEEEDEDERVRTVAG